MLSSTSGSATRAAPTLKTMRCVCLPNRVLSRTSAALATVTTIAYTGLLLGPALIGFVADATSLPVAFLLVAAMFGAVALAAGRVP